jgi:hypothetical protein
MPRTPAPASAPLAGLTLQAGRFGFMLSLSAAPFALRLVTWARTRAPEPYRLRGRAWRLGPLSWLRLRERTSR